MDLRLRKILLVLNPCRRNVIRPNAKRRFESLWQTAFALTKSFLASFLFTPNDICSSLQLQCARVHL
jgi:hypothetical protein